jgi:hypothetical protein
MGAFNSPIDIVRNVLKERVSRASFGVGEGRFTVSTPIPMIVLPYFFRIVRSVKGTGRKLCAERIDVRKTSIVGEIRRVLDFILCFGGVVTKNT